MKLFLLNLSLFLGLWGAVPTTPEIKFDDLRSCILSANQLDQRYRDLIPPAIFYLDRYLVRTSQRIPLMEENFRMLSGLEASNRYTVYMVDNAIVSCESIHADYKKRAQALFLFISAFGFTSVVFILSLSMRSVLLSTQPSPQPRDRVESRSEPPRRQADR